MGQAPFDEVSESVPSLAALGRLFSLYWNA